MKSSELQKQIRIGNYLLGKCIDDLDDRKEWWEIYKIQDAEHLMGIKKDWDKPVELTEEILLKIKNVVIEKETPFGKTFSLYPVIVKIILNDFYFIIGGFRINVRYLHQLQNLYFALTGTELEINL